MTLRGRQLDACLGWNDGREGGREERAGIIIVVRGKSYEIPRIMV